MSCSVRLTGRGAALLAFGVPMLGFGLWGAYPFMAALGAAALGAVLAAVLLTARTLRVEVRRSVYPGRVEKGDPAMARLRVNNSGRHRLAAFTTTDALGEATRTIRARPLRPGAGASYTYEIPTGKRGRLTVGPLTLHRVDPLELARSRHPSGATDTLWVHPRQYPARALTGGHRRHHHDGATTDDALRGSMEFVDLREYAPGDEFRLLHWKATARTGRLMVRELADPEQPRFTLLLDTRTTTFAEGLFEEAVDTAASLLAASARAGSHSRLITPAGLDVPMPGGPKAALRLLDELAQVGREGGRNSALVPAALSAGRGAGGVLVVVTSVTTRPAELARLRHRFPAIHMIVLAEEKPVAVTVPGVRILGAAGAEEAVRRWNEVATA
ncbi:hypothetical protein GCM10010191_45920 [Actinomadura vinacea]|uniref:DUF58 domain-containing protein n=1 Tax=Actinomadura vinacea TaxID=115336 RepID=A0ABN3JDV1_9ACTN